MFRPVTLSLCLALAAGPGHALRCASLDAAAMYRHAAGSEHRHVIVHGAFLRDGPDRPLPVETEEGAPASYLYDALFFGDIASRVGFHTPAELEVTVLVACVSAWCGTPPEDGEDVLAFLRMDDNRDYYLEVEPCPTTLLVAPAQDDLDRITACMAGRDCGMDD
ncbi:hypothetical protein DZD18_04015 [Rhodobacteraceae bacterium W635]|uniref:hypothetical protein n=1 Tax=Nioella halotolerans TaxID=2303578 RepID=UPI000E3B873E|nr:hypothetical protein DZD18_04015 [Rhodobacteraceae bacterium W635]